MSKINTLRFKVPKVAQRQLDRGSTSVEKPNSNNKLLFSLILTFLCLLNTSAFSQCITIPVSPVTISGEPYISTFSNINLNGTGTAAATALPGSSVSISFHQDMNFSGQYCLGCVTFHQVGVGGTQTPISCADNGQSLDVNTTFTAPNTPGVYYITMFNTLDYQCNTVNYSNSPSSAIAVLVVTPPSPTTISGQPYISTFTNVKLNGGSNGAFVNAGSSVSISFHQDMNYSGQHCPSCSTFHQVGVGGTQTPISCADNGQSLNVNTTFTAPNTPGIYYITMFNTLNYQCNTVNYSNSPSSAIAVIVVKDCIPPIITCPANIAVNTDVGVCGAKVTFSDATATDNCSATVTQTGGSTSGSTFPVGSSSVSYSAKDPSSNSASCSFTVTVSDNENPKIACPANIAVNTDLGVCGAKVTFNSATATDNCSATVTQTTSYTSGQTFPVGTSTITYSAKDPSNNTVICSFNVVVTDNEAPKITCPANISVNTDLGVCGAKVNFTVLATDNCSFTTGLTGLASGSTFPVGTTTNLFKATDASSNVSSCIFTVTVTDNEAPKITCPANISVNTHPGVCGAAVTFSPATANDNCSATVTQTTSYTSRQTFPVGTSTITYSAKDPSNNTASCYFNVVVTDNEAPKITCPANIYVNSDPSVCGAKVTFSAATATDNCSATVTQVTSYTSGQTFPVGTSTISYSAKDPSNNTASCSFNVVVTDNEAPKVTCPGNISVNTNLGVCGAKVNFTVLATDNCSFTTGLTGLASGSIFPVGTTTNLFKATDASNNVSSCRFTVTVKDNEVPKIICPDNISVNTNLGVCGAAVTFISATATDNCSATVTQTTSYTSGQTFPVGTTNIYYSAKDPSNNTVSCSFSVVVTDKEAPKITCPASVSKSSDVGICGAKYTFSTPIATDNCSAIVTQTGGLTSGSTFPVGINTVTFTAKDPSGNTTSCSFTVTVNSRASFNPNVCYNILNNGLPIVLQGDNAQLYSAKQTQVQSFKFIALPNGNIQILSSSDKKAGKSLSDEAPKGDSKVKLKDYKSEDLQSDWQINCVNGLYVITHKASGLVLTVGATANDGKTPIVLSAYNGSSSQSWTFQAVPCPAPDNGLQSKNISNLTGYAEQQRNVIDLTTNQGLTTDFYTVEKINKVSGNFEVLEHRANTEVTDKVKFITFYDNAPYEGDNVYRIKTTFLDGSEAYSNLQQINTKVTSEFSVFPNPTDEEAWIDLKSYSGKEVKLELTDLAGKTLQLEVINEATAAPHRLDLSSYTTGLYFIKVQTKGRQVLTKKLQVAK